jgi:uncharacterized protein YkwD
MDREPGATPSHGFSPLYLIPLGALLVLGLIFALTFLQGSSSSHAALTTSVDSPQTSPAGTGTSDPSQSSTGTPAVSPTSAAGWSGDLGQVRGMITLAGPVKAAKGDFAVFVLDGPKPLLKTDAKAPFSVRVQTKDLPNGKYTITVLLTHEGTTSLTSTSTARVTNAKPKAAPKHKASASASYLAQVLALVNGERRVANCKALTTSATLAQAAQEHSTDMAAHGYFSPKGRDGRSPFVRMTDAGYPFSAAAENIATGQLTPAAVMTAWMHSATHKANILNCTYTQLGVGYAKAKDGIPYWTQDFGKPL